MGDIKRREFITLIGGAAAAWPLAARAQQTERLRRIGVLTALAENDPEVKAWLRAFQEELQKLGWEQGRNIRIEYRPTGGDPNRLQTAAAELVGMRPDVLFANATPALLALKSGDPLPANRVRAGF
jgi:putative ABC transport system substrate-binding protein